MHQESVYMYENATKAEYDVFLEHEDFTHSRKVLMSDQTAMRVGATHTSLRNHGNFTRMFMRSWTCVTCVLVGIYSYLFNAPNHALIHITCVTQAKIKFPSHEKRNKWHEAQKCVNLSNVQM